MIVYSTAAVVVDSSDNRPCTTILGCILSYLSLTIFVMYCQGAYFKLQWSQSPVSFVGNNISLWPYFKEAFHWLPIYMYDAVSLASIWSPLYPFLVLSMPCPALVRPHCLSSIVICYKVCCLLNHFFLIFPPLCYLIITMPSRLGTCTGQPVTKGLELHFQSLFQFWDKQKTQTLAHITCQDVICRQLAEQLKKLIMKTLSMPSDDRDNPLHLTSCLMSSRWHSKQQWQCQRQS